MSDADLPPLPESGADIGQTLQYCRADMLSYAHAARAPLLAEIERLKNPHVTGEMWKRLAESQGELLKMNANERATAAEREVEKLRGLLSEAQQVIHAAGQFLKRHPATVRELQPFVEETEVMYEKIHDALADPKEGRP